MAGHPDTRLNGIKGKPVAMKTPATGKSVDGYSEVHARYVGQLLSRALQLIEVTPQEASFRMGYADQSKLSRWMSGADVPHLLGRFLAHADFCRGFMMAMAEARGDDITTELLIHVPMHRRQAS